MEPREPLDELFLAPLDAFVETRARLAAALIAAGQKAPGQALKKVRRPSPSAWATNQVVRRARGAVDAFLEASDRLRGSQDALVAGNGDRGVYQADVEDLRRATTALTDAARRILDELGRADDRPSLERVVANARAAALADAGRTALLGGALLADLEGGVDAFGGLLVGGAAPAVLPRVAPARPAAPAGARGPTPDAEALRRAAEARAQQEARARELEAARREEATAREAATASQSAAARALEGLDEARRQLEAAQHAAHAAEFALRAAEATLRNAQRDVTDSETRAGRATRRREALEK